MAGRRNRAINAGISRRHLLAGFGASGLAGVARPALAETGRIEVGPALIVHGKTGVEFMRLVAAAAQHGHEIRSLSLYGAASSPLYAALMTKAETPVTQRCVPSLTAAQVHAEVGRQGAENFGPAIVAATGSAASPVFAIVFEPQEAKPLVRLDLRPGAEKDAATFQGMVHQAKLKGLILRSVAVYGSGTERRFATIWGPNTVKIVWDADGIADDERAFRERLAAQTASWCRLKLLAAAPDGRFLSLYHLEDDGPWMVSENLTAERLQHETEAQAANGLQPIALQAVGRDAASARFNVIFAGCATPAPRRWTPAGPAAQAAIDEAMKGIMTNAAIRQAALAIVKGPRLVFARGYTFAEPDWPLAQPTTPFRVASLTKTVAALATYQLIEAGRVRLSDRMQDILQLRSLSGGPPKDPQFGKVTIEQLLAHTSGLTPHGVPSVAVHEAWIAAGHRPSHFPITLDMATSYVASQPLVSEPGAHYEYNNCAHFLLGRVVAKLHGTEHAIAALDKHLFAPLGITRIRRARSLLADQLPDEARYRVALDHDHVRILPLARSVMSDARPLVPIGYGHEQIEIHEGDSGLSAATVDLARLVAVMISRRDTPALRGDTIRTMLANAAARKGHGLDGAKDHGDGSFYGYKAGVLSSAWSALQFDGDLGFAVAWSGGVPADDVKWYPNLPPVMNVARHVAWGDDLFPQFGMPSLG